MIFRLHLRKIWNPESIERETFEDKMITTSDAHWEKNKTKKMYVNYWTTFRVEFYIAYAFKSRGLIKWLLFIFLQVTVRYSKAAEPIFILESLESGLYCPKTKTFLSPFITKRITFETAILLQGRGLQ